MVIPTRQEQITFVMLQKRPNCDFYYDNDEFVCQINENYHLIIFILC
jgi:hypothetical protein